MRKESMFLLVSVFLLAGLLTFVIAENDSTEISDLEEDVSLENSCNNLYWVDNTNKDCSQKEFCGAYMYYGLNTFQTKEECLDFLEDETEDDEDEEETEQTILGASCGTVTPGYQNECCERKGYDSWDSDKFECVKETEEEEDERDERVGNSCGTVTPGMENQCCQRKGYLGWDPEEFECVDKEDIEEENECEEWNCTRWSECSLDGIRTRECVSSGLTCADEEDDEDETEEEDQPRLTRECYERKELRPHEGPMACPEECVCSGSAIKCSFENGTREMTIYAGQSGNVIIQIKNLNMSTNVTLYKGENGKVYANFSNNRTKEIHLPDEVKDKIQDNTRTRLYNESINLTEDGYYKIEGKKKARLFWIVPVKEHIKAEIDAETGETLKMKNPWWGFLARDVKEDTEEEEEIEVEDNETED